MKNTTGPTGHDHSVKQKQKHMIIILTLCWILLTAMAVSCGIREGRYREREAIKRAWSQSQLATHDWLNGDADELPTIADND